MTISHASHNRAFLSLRLASALLASLLAASLAGAAPIGVYQRGTVVRMRMQDCTFSPRGFLANFSPAGPATSADACQEYTLVSEKVVYVVVGKSSNQLIPLADAIDFRLSKNELAVRLDDSRHESRFGIKEMILRADWEIAQHRLDAPAAGATLPASTTATDALAARKSPE